MAEAAEGTCGHQKKSNNFLWICVVKKHHDVNDDGHYYMSAGPIKKEPSK